MKYSPQAIEQKWQDIWEKTGVNESPDYDPRPKYYCLAMFPYPSGSGIHVGHWRNYVLPDVAARIKKAQGYNVLHPIGWDAFGLPAENYAIANKTHPRLSTDKNIQAIKRQFEMMGTCYDWSREIDTTDPEYYKYTQWIFLQMYKRGLAYRSELEVNWCEALGTVLANEEVIDGKSERGGHPVTKKKIPQWVLKITAYADRLLSDLDQLDWPEKVKTMQRNWIGKSEGTLVRFAIKDTSQAIEVFTTRVDTLFGCTYIVVAPEHALVQSNDAGMTNYDEVEQYIKKSQTKTNVDRLEDTKEKTGVRLEGVMAINPINNEEIPVFVADYVLGDYGTGAVMAVPAHDERDWAFAQKFGLPVIESVRPSVVDHVNPPQDGKKTVVRRNVHAIVFDPKTEKYLILKNEKFGWNTVVIGGVEDGEDLIDAARREVAEETGYTDLEFRRILGNPVQAAYFAKHKDENRVAIATAVYFELKSNERVTIPTDGENEGNEIVWVDTADFVPGKMVNSELPIWLVRLQKTEDFAYIDDGVLVNSGVFDGLTSPDARLQIAQKLTSSNDGELRINYKLRDWIFSRQRYWGEPIPLIHCENCEDKVKNTPHKLSFFRNDLSWQHIVNGQKIIETRALNPDEPDRYFGNIRVGEYLRMVRKDTGETVYCEVKNVYQFKNLEELYEHKDILKKIHPWFAYTSLDQLKDNYASTPDYLEKIEKNGLIGWEIALVQPGWIPVPELELPLKLPEVEKYQPTGTGESPLADIPEFVNTACPVCGGLAKRETNTMPQWAGSSWYYLAFAMRAQELKMAEKPSASLINKEYQEVFKYWLPVDLYLGGVEHAVLHLLYARFWHKVLFDIGVVDHAEPFKYLFNQGMVTLNGAKMSKSKGNVVSPDEMVAQYGADALRAYELFVGPPDQDAEWSSKGLSGVSRFLSKVWDLATEVIAVQQTTAKNQIDSVAGPQTQNNPALLLSTSIEIPETELQVKTHQTIKKFNEALADFRYNTLVSTLMEFTNTLIDHKETLRQYPQPLVVLIQLLSPICPHISEELWEMLGFESSLFSGQYDWPMHNEQYLIGDLVTITIQENGKLRGTLEVAPDSDQAAVESVLKETKYSPLLDGAKKIVYVKNKIINVVK